ncbi:MAG: hypothetical protein DMG05_14700 [Acidobacteria bacterium]|nr:MAG: hypothetical protein DMG05_14700 [Acidobacteriota bacterium]
MRHGKDFVQVAGEAEKVRRHNGPRLGGDGPLERFRIEVEGGWIDVGKHRLETCDTRQLWYDPERKCRQDDLRARRQSERLENIIEGHAAKRG